MKGRQELQKHLQDCILNEGGVVEETEADSSKSEIFNCVISAHGEADRAGKRVADVALWHSTWLPARSPRYLRLLSKWYLRAVESDEDWLLNDTLRSGET